MQNRDEDISELENRLENSLSENIITDAYLQQILRRTLAKIKKESAEASFESIEADIKRIISISKSEHDLDYINTHFIELLSLDEGSQATLRENIQKDINDRQEMLAIQEELKDKMETAESQGKGAQEVIQEEMIKMVQDLFQQLEDQELAIQLAKDSEILLVQDDEDADLSYTNLFQAINEEGNIAEGSNIVFKNPERFFDHYREIAENNNLSDKETIYLRLIQNNQIANKFIPMAIKYHPTVNHEFTILVDKLAQFFHLDHPNGNTVSEETKEKFSYYGKALFDPDFNFTEEAFKKTAEIEFFLIQLSQLVGVSNNSNFDESAKNHWGTNNPRIKNIQKILSNDSLDMHDKIDQLEEKSKKSNKFSLFPSKKKDNEVEALYSYIQNKIEALKSLTPNDPNQPDAFTDYYHSKIQNILNPDEGENTKKSKNTKKSNRSTITNITNITNQLDEEPQRKSKPPGKRR
jgi:hypothetical protein